LNTGLLSQNTYEYNPSDLYEKKVRSVLLSYTVDSRIKSRHTANAILKQAGITDVRF
jgi:hypothetical protein